MFAQLAPNFIPPPWRRIGRPGLTRTLVVALLAAAFFSGARSAYAATITVDGTNCTLAEAIDSANADNANGNGCTDGSGADVLNITADVTLGAALPALSSNMTIQGNVASRFVSGNDVRRVFRVDSGIVTFQNLTIKNGKDVGGAGSAGWDGGGGGLGAGGGLYIDNGTVVVQNVTFDHNNATGGAGSVDSSDVLGGAGGGSTNAPTAGGASGTNGSFGGGGGGASDGNDGNPNAGNGGFGGGGGGSAGRGGVAGKPQFGGAADANSLAGGGGAGLGGAIFIRTGVLTLINNTFTNNTAIGGDSPNDGGGFPANPGQGVGGNLFICTSGDDDACGAKVSSATTIPASYGPIDSTTSLQPTSQLTQQPYVQSCATGSNGYAKNCTLKFPLKNTSGGQLQIRYEQITSISSHVFVLNGAPSPGQVNTVVNDTQDLANNASFNATFTLGLTSSTTYSLKFKVYGYTGSVVAAGADQASAVELGEYEVTITPDAVGNVKLFLPVVNR